MSPYTYMNPATMRDIMHAWGPKKIALLGYGRAGKDTAAGWLGLFTPLRYVGSTSMVACPMIAESLGISVEEAWATRHQHRGFWYSRCNEYRKDDPTKLARKSLEYGDLVVGLRDKVELQACKDAGLFDLTIWVANCRVPYDSTVTFTAEDCDVILENNTGYAQFYERLMSLCRFGGIMVDEAARGFDSPTVSDEGVWFGPTMADNRPSILPPWYKPVLTPKDSASV
jgi:hypothetical protein